MLTATTFCHRTMTSSTSSTCHQAGYLHDEQYAATNVTSTTASESRNNTCGVRTVSPVSESVVSNTTQCGTVLDKPRRSRCLVRLTRVHFAGDVATGRWKIDQMPSELRRIATKRRPSDVFGEAARAARRKKRHGPTVKLIARSAARIQALSSNRTAVTNSDASNALNGTADNMLPSSNETATELRWSCNKNICHSEERLLDSTENASALDEKCNGVTSPGTGVEVTCTTSSAVLVDRPNVSSSAQQSVVEQSTRDESLAQQATPLPSSETSESWQLRERIRLRLHRRKEDSYLVENLQMDNAPSPTQSASSVQTDTSTLASHPALNGERKNNSMNSREESNKRQQTVLFRQLSGYKRTGSRCSDGKAVGVKWNYQYSGPGVSWKLLRQARSVARWREICRASSSVAEPQQTICSSEPKENESEQELDDELETKDDTTTTTTNSDSTTGRDVASLVESFFSSNEMRNETARTPSPPGLLSVTELYNPDELLDAATDCAMTNRSPDEQGAGMERENIFDQFIASSRRGSLNAETDSTELVQNSTVVETSVPVSDLSASVNDELATPTTNDAVSSELVRSEQTDDHNSDDTIVMSQSAGIGVDALTSDYSNSCDPKLVVDEDVVGTGQQQPVATNEKRTPDEYEFREEDVPEELTGFMRQYSLFVSHDRQRTRRGRVTAKKKKVPTATLR